MQATDTSEQVGALEVFPPVPIIYRKELILSLRDLVYCKEKPAGLPDIIDKEKTSEPSKSIRKPRRQGGPEDGEGGNSQSVMDQAIDGGEGNSFQGRGKGGKGMSNRGRDNTSGWQPYNHQEHEDNFVQGASSRNTGKGVGARNMQGQIIPGKGAPRRDRPAEQAPAAKSGPSWDHQPALANVVSKQQQGMTGAPGSSSGGVKGLDAFSMGDIRQAEKFIEGGRMGLDEYAKKVAAGEISRDFVSEQNGAGGFFAEEGEDAGGRPWMTGQPRSTPRPVTVHGRIVPGSAAQRPPPPPAADLPVGKDSNVAGLALLQMLVDRKATTPSPPPPVVQAKSPAGPRQLSPQQINDLIAMSKRAPPHQPAAPQLARPAAARIIPGQQARGHQPAAPQSPTPQVAALLEQLHRQQLAQQQATQPQSQPQECQQQ